MKIKKGKAKKKSKKKRKMEYGKEGENAEKVKGEEEKIKTKAKAKAVRESKAYRILRFFGRVIKRTWNFLWYSNSILSWIFLIVLAFLIVKFIFFPLMSFILHTKMPFVIVESYSMHHCNSIKGNILWHCGFDEYWDYYGKYYEERNINKEKFASFKFKNGLDAGDIVVVKGKKKYEVGEIIVFFANHKPIIHRIMNKTCESGSGNESRREENTTKMTKTCVYETKGDNNFAQLNFEKEIMEEQIVGKAVAKIPKLGWIKLLPYKIFFD